MKANILEVTTLLQVFDMNRSLAFYRDLLGFEVDSTSGPDPYWVMLAVGNTKLMLNTAYERDARPDSPDLARMLNHADTVLYLTCDDVTVVFEHLQSAGWDTDATGPTATHYGMTQLYVNDPDGYQICFQQPTVKDAADSHDTSTG